MVLGLAFAVIALQAPPKYAGLYRTVSLDASGRNREAVVRPGEVRYLRLGANRLWEWRDMMVGFSGTWSTKGRDLRLQVLMTPRGKPPRPQVLRLQADASGKRLRAMDPKLGGRRLEFIYDPTLLKRLAKQMEQRLREKKQQPLKKGRG